MTELDQEASSWVARLDRPDWSPDDDREFQAWLSQSPRHKGALLQAQATWMLFDKARPPDALHGEPAHHDLPILTPSRMPIARRRLLAMGGGLVACVAGGYVFVSRRGVIGTSLGEMRRVPMADGSLAAINTASEIDVAFSNTLRLVNLNRGEAWFSVAKDKAKPFIVQAGDVAVRAVGTAFSVRRQQQGVDILVTEGIVEVQVDKGHGKSTMMKEGDRAFVSHDAGQVQVEYGASVERTLAWREGRIELAGDDLATAIDEFNRYSSRPIILADKKLANRQLDGIFRTDDPVGFARAVEFTLNVPVEIGNGRILIGRDPS